MVDLLGTRSDCFSFRFSTSESCELKRESDAAKEKIYHNTASACILNTNMQRR